MASSRSYALSEDADGQTVPARFGSVHTVIISEGSLLDSRGLRANIRPFNDMERDLLLAGYRGELRVN